MGIEFVIVIVMAVLILTLGTGFIRNLFQNINTIGGAITEDAIKQLSEQLKKDPNKECALTTGDEATAKRDAQNQFKILINNKGPGDYCYSLSFVPSGTNKIPSNSYAIDTVSTAWISSEEVRDIPILMKLDPDVQTGKYIFNFKLGKYSQQQVQNGNTCDKVDVSKSIPASFPCTKTFVLNVE